MNDNVQTEQAIVPVKKPFLSILGLLIGGFVGMLSETSLNIALPVLMANLHISISTVQWLVTGYMLVIGIILPLSSLLTRWFTTRQLTIFALLDFAIGALISAFAPNFVVLLIGRMIQGIATGIIVPLMFTVATLIYPPYKLGIAMGMMSMVIMLAPAIGPTLTGLILGVLTWRWIFLLFIPFLLIGLGIAIKFLPNTAKITRPKIDIISVLLSTFSFGALVVGVSLISSYGWTSPVVISIIILAIILLIIYINRQIKLKDPILNFRIFKIAAFRIGTILVMLDFGIILSSMYLLPMFWQKGLAISVALTGLVMLPGGIANAVVSAISGRLFNRLGVRKLASVGFLISIVGIIMLICTSSHSHVWYVILAHIILMIGAPLAMSPSQTYGLNALSHEVSSDGSTIMNTFQQIVGAIATAIATSLLSLGQILSHNHVQTIAFTHGVHLGLYFTLLLAIIALLISLTIKNNSQKQ